MTAADDLPSIGFGTWNLDESETCSLTLAALDLGYRLVDTATLYGNEEFVGRAVRESGVPRDQVWITTKLLPQHWHAADMAIENSLRALSTDYVDLWLLHAHPGKNVMRAWEAMTVQQQRGKVRHIGVSNFRLQQVLELCEIAPPSVLQIPWSPWRHSEARLRRCVDLGVRVQAYSPLRSSKLDHPVLRNIARVHDRTPAQVVIRWHMHHAIPVLCTSRSRLRLAENLHSSNFELSDEDIDSIDQLANEGRKT